MAGTKHLASAAQLSVTLTVSDPRPPLGAGRWGCDLVVAEPSRTQGCGWEGREGWGVQVPRILSRDMSWTLRAKIPSRRDVRAN